MTRDRFSALLAAAAALGLNAYEARSYLVLVGHPRFKALELAARAHVPAAENLRSARQPGGEGLRAGGAGKDQTVLGRRAESARSRAFLRGARKSCSRNSPTRRAWPEVWSTIWHRRTRKARADAARSTICASSASRGRRPVQYPQMLAEVRDEYLEFSRPPYAVDPLDEQLVKQARARGVACRLLIEHGTLDDAHRQRLDEYLRAGVEVRQADSLPMKLALFDGRTRPDRAARSGDHQARPGPQWCFEHAGMGEAMKGLFENYWRRAS